MIVAALFVQPEGCYANDPRIDAWPEHRDARLYDGPLPVVAHPPCQLWGNLAAVNYKRWGGEHNKPGNDSGCFASALRSVMLFGGVLEHPAKSKAFAVHGIQKPVGVGWQQSDLGGWVCEVWQSAYGHRANKATWLYYRGSRPPFDLEWGRPSGTHQVGYQDQRGKARNKPTLCKTEANATPVLFRETLIALAEWSQVGLEGGSRMTPTERRSLHSPAVVEAWEWLDTYARHWAVPGRDWQTLDNLGGDDRVTAEAHLATLRSAGLIEPQTDFKGNFVKMGL